MTFDLSCYDEFETPVVCTDTAPLTATRWRRALAIKTVEGPVWVYKITHIATGRGYIGITNRIDPFGRWKEHVSTAHRMHGRLARALHKYGETAFQFVVVYEAVSIREACAVERGLIAQYGTFFTTGAGFNMSSGGELIVGVKRSAETKEKLRQFRLGKKWSDESRAKASASHKGKRWSAEKKAAHLASVQTDEYREKMSLLKTGVKHPPPSEEVRRRLGLAQKLKMSDPARRAALAEKAKENFSDPEYRAKFDAGIARRNAKWRGND